MELISKKTNIDFIGLRWYAIGFSILLALGTAWLWVKSGESKYSTDFVGGHEYIVKLTQGGNSENIRSALDKEGIGEATVQAFEIESNEYAIRLGGNPEESAAIRAKVDKALSDSFPSGYEIKASGSVGPSIGSELKRKAIIALSLGLIGILLYMTYRFEFAFALGGVVALFHDVILGLGGYLACGHALNMASVAAALTIVGYSVNDTIVVFDRIREEMRKGTYNLRDAMNKSMNAVLSRTIVTSLLTLFSAVSLLVFGGGAIRDLSLFLVIGIIAGSYSTIFIASPVALMWEQFRGRAVKS